MKGRAALIALLLAASLWWGWRANYCVGRVCDEVEWCADFWAGDAQPAFQRTARMRLFHVETRGQALAKCERIRGGCIESCWSDPGQATRGAWAY